MAATLWRNQNLIKTLIKREVIGRYRGSVLGILWSFLNPVFMLLVYTFMFSVVFKARWHGGSDSKTEFALILFAGLMVFNLFAEVLNRAPSLILSNVNYVKKIIFPLEILPLAALGTATFHLMISFFVWIIFYFIFFGLPPLTAIFLPIILVPLMLLTLGFAWLLASLGVYLRDVGQIISVSTTALMFLSPVFYPVSALPPDYQTLFLANPITPIVEAVRGILIWGKYPDWALYLSHFFISIFIAWLGFAWFQLTRKGFADVL